MDLAALQALLQDLGSSLVKALGIVWPEVWAQMIIFLVAYLALSQLIFRPYMKAFIERQKSTEGNAELAERLLLETAQLQREYEKQAKDLNSKFKAIYEESRGQAVHERDQIISKARSDVEASLESSKEAIQNAIGSAQKELEKEIPFISSAVTGKLLGRELAQ
jgi:F-type H+-transporting ATPase subunit b